MRGTLVVFAILILATFAARANDYFRGTKSTQNGLFLRLLIVGCFIAPLTMGLWQTALAMFAIWLVMLRPLAGLIGPRLAIRLWRTGEQGPFERWVGRPPSRLRRIYAAMEQMSEMPDADIQAFMRNAEQRSLLKAAALDYSLGQPEIQAVLRRFDKDRKAVEELFRELTAAGIGGMRMGHYLPEAIAQHAKPLSFLLEWNKDRSKLSHHDVVMSLVRYFECGRVLPPTS